MSREKRKPDCHPDRKHQGLGLCVACYQRKNRTPAKRAYALEYYRRPENVAKEYNGHLKRAYGVDSAHVEALWVAQGSRCALAGNGKCAGNLNRAKCVDHEMTPDGKIVIRGILCLNHNIALGKFGDRYENFLAVCAYLSKNK